MRLLYGVLTDILPVITGKRRLRFDGKIDRLRGTDICHPWLGHKSGCGYGLFQGSIRYQGYSFLAHRVAWALCHSKEPGNLVVRHDCDNPPCCNERHLRIGTHQDNTQDMIDRGRQGDSGKGRPRGPHWHNKTKPEQARYLRYVERWPVRRIADLLQVHRATIHRWLAHPSRREAEAQPCDWHLAA